MPIGASRGEDPLFTFKLNHSTDGKSRKIWGVATTPAMDREKEIIAEGAITKALEDFMALPIIHYYHSERPIGWITKARYGEVTLSDGKETRGLEVEGEIKATPDTDDIWHGIVKGEIDEWSIFGTRKAGSRECNIPADKRTSPCITKAMYLWSISLCPRGTGQNRTTFVEIVKAMTSGGSALIHPTVDGTRRIRKMDEPGVDSAAPPVDGGPGDAPRSPEEIMEEILSAVMAISDHLGVGGGDNEVTEEGQDELPPIPPPTAQEEVEKAEGTGLDDVAKEDDLEKCTGLNKKEVKKAEDAPQGDQKVDPSIVKAQADRIAALEAELNELKKRTPQGRTIVVDPTIAKGAKPSLDGKTNTTPGTGTLSTMARIEKILQR